MSKSRSSHEWPSRGRIHTGYEAQAGNDLGSGICWQMLNYHLSSRSERDPIYSFCQLLRLLNRTPWPHRAWVHYHWAWDRPYGNEDVKRGRDWDSKNIVALSIPRRELSLRHGASSLPEDGAPDVPLGEKKTGYQVFLNYLFGMIKGCLNVPISCAR